MGAIFAATDSVATLQASPGACPSALLVAHAFQRDAVPLSCQPCKTCVMPVLYCGNRRISYGVSIDVVLRWQGTSLCSAAAAAALLLLSGAGQRCHAKPVCSGECVARLYAQHVRISHFTSCVHNAG
jgi:hypothetical protein